MNTDKTPSAMRLISVPLDALERHAENVRKAPTDEEADAALVASIRAHGLLSPLVVEGSEKRARVIGGGRRLAALSAIAGLGVLPRDHPVPCVLVGGPGELGLGAVIELSLAENAGRQRMHPADEAAAFTALRERGATDKQLAKRFGVSPRTVQRRLRIGRAAPELLERCRSGELHLGVVEAALLAPDHEAQIAAVAAAEGHPHPAGAVRAHITRDGVHMRTSLAQFVGRHDYETQGGYILKDPTDGEEFMTDRELAATIALERLEDLAQEARDRGWPKVTAGLRQPDQWWETHCQFQPPEDGGPPEGDLSAWLHLSINWDGSEAARLALHPVPDRAPAKSAAGSEAAPGLGKSLLDDLKLMRLSIEREALSRAPADLARDILLFELVRPHAGWLGTRSHPHEDFADLTKTDAPACVGLADKALTSRSDALFPPDGSGSVEDEWAALRAMPEKDKARLMACCVARLLPWAGHDGLAEVDIDWRSAWWADASVLSRMTKPQLMDAAGGVAGLVPELDELRKLRKGDLVERLERALHDGLGTWIPAAVFGEDA